MSASLDVLRVSRVMSATPDRVYRAWTTPDELKKWFGRPEGYEITNAELDVRVGGRYRIEIGLGDVVGVIVGMYREVSPPHRLVFTFGWEESLIDVMDIGETVVAVEFKALNGSTEVVISHERLLQPAVVMFHQFGWTNGLDRLEGLLSAG